MLSSEQYIKSIAIQIIGMLKYSKSLSYTVLRTAVLSSTDFSKVPKSFVLHENLEQCEFLYIWIWVTRIFVLSNTMLRVILSWIQMFWAARFLSYTDFPLSKKSCSSRSYCMFKTYLNFGAFSYIIDNFSWIFSKSWIFSATLCLKSVTVAM